MQDEDEDGPSISIIQDSINDDSQVQDQVGSSSALSPSTQEPIVSQRIHHVLVKGSSGG